MDNEIIKLANEFGMSAEYLAKKARAMSYVDFWRWVEERRWLLAHGYKRSSKVYEIAGEMYCADMIAERAGISLSQAKKRLRDRHKYEPSDLLLPSDQFRKLYQGERRDKDNV